MADLVTAAPGLAAPSTRGRWRARLRGAGVLVPAAIVLGYLLIALAGPLVLDYDPAATEVTDRLLPPGSTLEDGSTAWLGTDAVGRDLLAQIVQGARVSMTVGLAVILVAGLGGALVGLLVGYARGPLDTVVMRAIDVQLAFPPILLAIIVAGVLGQSVLNVVLALAVTRWVIFARVARGSTLSLREREWVAAAHVMGVRTRAVLGRHISPFLAGPLVAVATLEFGLVILAEAGLSFLGLGLPADASSWGQTIANGKEYLTSAWWISAFPGLALALLVIAIGLLGDRLTDRLGGSTDRT